MVDITGVEQKRCWDARILPPVERVRDGLWSIPVPLPNNPLRYVLVYALELAGDAGVALIDAGWDTEEAWTALVDGLGHAGFGISDVRGVLVTHIHPDHYGLAGRVRDVSGAWVALHPADAATIPDRYGDGMDKLIIRIGAGLDRCGVPPLESELLSKASVGLRSMVNVSLPDILMEDGDRADLPGWDLTAIWTPGHSPGHLCFVSAERRLILTGDHVLPRITPAIAVHAQQADNPLAQFLTALRRVGALEAELGLTEVLPAHEYRFAGLAARTAEIAAHHEARLEELVGLLTATPGATCWELTERLTWSRPWEEINAFMRRSATGETLAHLVLLASRGRARVTGDMPERWFAA